MTDWRLTESSVEDAALAWLEVYGWQVARGPEIAPDMPAAERATSSCAPCRLTVMEKRRR